MVGIQTLLYLYLYGISHNKSIIKLFKVHTGNGIITLRDRSMYNIIAFLRANDGVIEEDDYSHMYNQLYEYCVRYSVEHDISYPGTIHNRHITEEWKTIIRVWILKNYPNIIKELKALYPDIKFFL